MRLESVGKRYGLRQPWVVRDVSLDVPPGRLIRLLRHPGAAMLSTLAVAIFALASDVSPASAALRRAETPHGAQGPGPVPLLAAGCLLAVIWGASLYAGARRDNRAPGAT